MHLQVASSLHQLGEVFQDDCDLMSALPLFERTRPVYVCLNHISTVFSLFSFLLSLSLTHKTVSHIVAL
jgi:hypothetical protein